MVRTRFRRGPTVAAAGLLVAGLTVGLATVPSVATENDADQQRVEDCANADALLGMEDNFVEECLTEAELAEAEASIDAEAAATAAAFPILNQGEVASTPNLSLLSNTPKSAGVDATNSDIAFQGKHAFVGNYNGFTVYDISNPKEPSVVAAVVCPGSQNDISVYGNLLFLSTDAVRSDDSCNSSAGQASNPTMWEGMKIWDISDIKNPRYIKSVRTACGSHTHTLLPGKDGQTVYVYVSSYSPSNNNFYCRPPHDAISIIEVPLASPTAAEVVNVPNLFPGSAGANSTSGCHDITVYPERDIAAGACMGDGILLDIKDPVNPVVTSRVRDTNFAFWHSATFNNDATKVIFTDELGGGGSATCRPQFRMNQGANGIYDIVDGQLTFASYFKIPRENKSVENCVAHNGSLIPVKGKDYFVQSWYQGGITVFDFTDSKNPVEIAWFDRGPNDDTRLVSGGTWSTAYYNGYIYSTEILRGFDVFEIKDPRVASAKGNPMKEFNAQTQPRYIDAPGLR